MLHRCCWLIFVSFHCCCHVLKAKAVASKSPHATILSLLCRNSYYGNNNYYRNDDRWHDSGTYVPTQNYDSGYYDNSYTSYSEYDGGNWYPSRTTALPLACDSPQDNPRGFYGSHLAPCQFSFHHIPAKTDNGDGIHLSTMCNDKNRLSLSSSSSFKASSSNATASNKMNASSTNMVVKIYADSLYDECVGDFRRCYSLERDQSVFLNFICSIQIDIPANTTHISVDCSKDKALKQEKLANQNYYDSNEADINAFTKESLDNQEEQADRWKQVEILISVLLGFMVVACCCFSLVAYKCMIQPHLESNVHHPHDISEVNTLMTQQEQHDEFSSTARVGVTAAQVL